ncbi:MAG: alpha/beta fold hydrolase [Sandarakinorhabdus sp.]|nr:alpha/beta fold hydrolase [Sandarakinorhabdus sp.]
MAVIHFRGFAGIRLEADQLGLPDDPPVLLLHGVGQTRTVWADAAEALVMAGRLVVNLDLRGHGASEWPVDGRYDAEAFVEDIRAVLGQMAARPLIVAASLGGWVALEALGREAAQLASALVLADAPPTLDPVTATQMAAALRARAARAPVDWDVRVLDRFDSAAVPDRIAALAPQIAIPTLFVRGALSPISQEADVAGFVAAMPDCALAEIEDAGHLVAAERADAFNAVLLEFLEQRVPRAAPEYRSGSDPRTLRDALGCFATGVTVVTAFAPDGTPIGLTANSFTSVSLIPPLLLVCIDRRAGSLPALELADGFAVNVLHIGQQPTSNRFARPGADRFADTAWDTGEFGAPVLAGTLAAFECRRHALHDGGDHVILIGEVVKARFEPRRDPLLYFRGKYRRLHFS